MSEVLTKENIEQIFSDIDGLSFNFEKIEDFDKDFVVTLDRYLSLTPEKIVLLREKLGRNFYIEADIKWVGHCSGCSEPEPRLIITIPKNAEVEF